MRQEKTNEMDLLLRRLGRRKDGSASDADLRIEEDHLDADELSSYAENVLPAPARARYTEHLSECSSCRELVVQLSSSVAVVSAEEISTGPELSGFRKFLASLLSPMVLRYAAPALGLIVVAVIGLVVLRRDGASELVTLRQEAPRTPAAETQVPLPGGEAQSRDGVTSNSATPQALPNKQEQNKQPPPPNTPFSVGVTADVKETEAPTQKPEPQSSVSPPPPKPEAVDAVQGRSETGARRQSIQTAAPAANEAPRERADERAKEEDRKTGEVVSVPSLSPAKNRARSAEPAEVQRGTGSIAKIQRDGLEKKDNDDAETRSVAGRRFRRQRSIWIDTAYESSKGTVNLTRGSEQYRALVADEPAIQNIAEQLDGEIIVVWKGRAYRIR